MPKVKGLAFRSVLQAHASMRGEACLAQTFLSMQPELAKALSTPIASIWYPLEFYTGLWDAIQQVTSRDPEYPRLIGRRCIEQDLNLVQKFVFSALNTSAVLEITKKLFGNYYDTGTCTTSRVDAGTVRVSFDGCVGFTLPIWSELRGTIESFAEHVSKKPVHSTLLRGGRSGCADCTVDVYW